jgi:outer membrane immunogenic protein
MGRFLYPALASIGIAAGSAAMAADVPVKPPVHKAAAVVVSPWAGGYLGLQGGWGFGNSRHTNTGFNSGNFDLDGGIAGFTSGYNWQRGSWVFGYESDTSYSWIDGRTGGTCAPRCTTDLGWLSTYRLRLGNTTPDYFPYVTGGLAMGTVEAGAGPDGSETLFGWTAGLGLEGKLAEKWTGKIEYLYVDLGKEDIFNVAGSSQEVRVRSHILRAGLNYKFSIWDWLFQRR